MSDKTKTLAIIRSESLVQSLLSDGATALMLLLCIWFSHHMGGGMWEVVCFAMLVFWLGCKLPGDMKLVRKLTSKREAIEWAHALADDGSTEHGGSRRMLAPEPWPDPRECGCTRSHPHENMSPECEARTVETRQQAKARKAVPFGWRDVIDRARDSIGGGAYSENQQYELSIVGPYLDGIADEFEHLQEVCEAVGQLGLDSVNGDVLPQVGDKVLIHLGRSDRWVEHTVVGYYVWKDLAGDDSLHRVFVRVKDSEGNLNARMLKDVRPVAAKIGGAA